MRVGLLFAGGFEDVFHAVGGDVVCLGCYCVCEFCFPDGFDF